MRNGFGRKTFPALVALAGSLTMLLTLDATAMDQGFAGPWVTTVDTGDSSWEIRWDIRPDGSYHASYTTLKGSVNLPDEDGKLVTDGKTYSVATQSGKKDGGTIQLHGDTLICIGGLGKTIWTRRNSPFTQQNQSRSTQIATPPKAPPDTATSNPAAVIDAALLPESRYLSLTEPKRALARFGSAQRLFNEGMSLKNADQFADAAGKFSEALSADPQMIDAHLQRGICLTHMEPGAMPPSLMQALPYAIRGGANLKHLAIGDFTHVIQVQPTNAKAWCMRGLAKLELLAVHSAIKDFTQAIALNPKYATAFANRAIAEMHLNTPTATAAASSDLRQAYTLDPSLKPTFDKMRAEAQRFAKEQAALAAAAARRSTSTSGPDYDPGGPFHLSSDQLEAMREHDARVEADRRHDEDEARRTGTLWKW